jgi:hypothetical protein
MTTILLREWVKKKVNKVLGLYIHKAELANPFSWENGFTLTLGTEDAPTHILTIRDVSESGYYGEQYLHTDDDLDSFIGARFRGLEVREVKRKKPNNRTQEHYWHDIGFLYIKTSLGPIVLETHKLQNGYYGGFVIGATLRGVKNA